MLTDIEENVRDAAADMLKEAMADMAKFGNADCRKLANVPLQLSQAIVKYLAFSAAMDVFGMRRAKRDMPPMPLFQAALGAVHLTQNLYVKTSAVVELCLLASDSFYRDGSMANETRNDAAESMNSLMFMLFYNWLTDVSISKSLEQADTTLPHVAGRDAMLTWCKDTINIKTKAFKALSASFDKLVGRFKAYDNQWWLQILSGFGDASLLAPEWQDKAPWWMKRE